MPCRARLDVSLPSNKLSNRGSSINCNSLNTACWCHTSSTTVKTPYKSQIHRHVENAESCSAWKHDACFMSRSSKTESNLRSCERPRLIIWGVIVELRLRFPSTSSSDLSVCASFLHSCVIAAISQNRGGKINRHITGREVASVNKCFMEYVWFAVLIVHIWFLKNAYFANKSFANMSYFWLKLNRTNRISIKQKPLFSLFV